MAKATSPPRRELHVRDGVAVDAGQAAPDEADRALAVDRVVVAGAVADAVADIGDDIWNLRSVLPSTATGG
jgi:hypothetical protein